MEDRRSYWVHLAAIMKNLKAMQDTGSGDFDRLCGKLQNVAEIGGKALSQGVIKNHRAHAHEGNGSIYGQAIDVLRFRRDLPGGQKANA